MALTARRARTRAARTRAAVVVLAGALLAGCGVLPDDGASSPTPSRSGAPSPAEPTASPTATPPPAAEPGAEPGAGPDEVRDDGVAVLVGDRTVLHAAADGAALTAVPEGDVTVLAAAGSPGTPVVVRLAPPSDATLSVQDDGSLVVLAADGAFLGGAARPVAVDGTTPVRITETDGVVHAAADGGALQVRVGGSALAGVAWGDREGGRSLAVSPTGWARTAGLAGEVGVWSELVVAVPEADTPVMRDQLTCHVLGAPDKETWNLEPWRPDVGLFAVLAAACNPA